MDTQQFQALWAEMKARTAAREELSAKLAQRSGGIRMHHDDGRRAAVTPDLERADAWRITWLDRDGPIGHTEYNDKRAAAYDALLQNFTPV